MSKELGTRPIELTWLKIKDINLQNGTVNIKSAKHCNARILKLKTRTLDMLKQYINKKDLKQNDRLFPAKSELHKRQLPPPQKQTSQKTARIQSILLTLVSTIIYVVLITIGFYTLPLELLNTVLSLIGGGGIIGLWGYRSKIEKRFMERNNSKQLKELSLDIIPN